MLDFQVTAQSHPDRAIKAPRLTAAMERGEVEIPAMEPCSDGGFLICLSRSSHSVGGEGLESPSDDASTA